MNTLSPLGVFFFSSIILMLYNKDMSCNCNRCGRCKSRCCDTACACPAPYLGIEQLPDNISVLRFNIDGKRTDYDFGSMIYEVQSDTSLSADTINRVLKYMAERHMDAISAQELGSIMHLADIGDVSSLNAKNGSTLVYNKSNDCGEGCFGALDSWRAWHALDMGNQVSSAVYPAVYKEDGYPATLLRPSAANEYYLLGWNGPYKFGYTQVPIVSASSVIDPADNKKIKLYLDPNTRQIVGVKE